MFMSWRDVSLCDRLRGIQDRKGRRGFLGNGDGGVGDSMGDD
jgi:hypothetical protein